jgi:hypothetical protein
MARVLFRGAVAERIITTLTVLLASSTANILLIQEPYWGPLIPRHSDTDPTGVPVSGTTAHPGWDVFHPSPHPTEYPQVATFVQREVCRSFRVVPDALIDKYFALALSFALPPPFPSLTVVNFYHHVTNHTPLLNPLLTCHIDPARCLLLCGDFNTHSELWLLADIWPSLWAPTLEEWLDKMSLWSLVPDGVITHCRGTTKPSLIDLMFGSPGFFEVPAIPGECSVSFGDSLGSNHAALLVGLPLDWTSVAEQDPVGWPINTGLREMWVDRFRGQGHAPQMEPSSKSELYEVAEALALAIDKTSKSLFQPRRVTTRGLPWWNDACQLAVAALHGLHGDDRQQAYRVLWMMIQTAKCGWFEDLLEDPDVVIWDLAKWHHGHWARTLLPIQDSTGLTMEGPHMAVAFHACFFLADHALPTLAPKLPFPPFPMREFYPVTREEVTTALHMCSNKSAPGPSGTPYTLVRWVHDTFPNLLPSLFTAVLRLRHHSWTTAKVVIIPKPGKADYLAPRAYCPISLLESTGKVLEKVVAAQLGLDVDHFGLIPPSQFGSHHFHSAPNAATMFRYKAESTIQAGRIGMVILMDILWFFDSLNPSLMEWILLHLRVDACTAAWTRSLMIDCEVSLHVNGFISEGFHLGWGMPQGSPASPIISALFTSPLLHTTQGWDYTDFSLYVDDRAVFASGPTFDLAAGYAAWGANEVLWWL